MEPEKLPCSPITGRPMAEGRYGKNFFSPKYSFSLLEDLESELLMTWPQPSCEEFQKYYNSSFYIPHKEVSNSVFDIIYQWTRSWNLRIKRSWLRKIFPDKGALLDYGCGNGFFLQSCQKDGWNVKGIEPSLTACLSAKKKVGYKVYQNLDQLKSKPASFDLITLWHVLEHVSDFMQLLFKLVDLLKTGGRCIIALPNYKSWDSQYYKQFWAAYDLPRHLWHFSPKTMIYLADRTHMYLQEIRPMFMDAFYISYLSEKNQDHSLTNLRALLSGIYSNLSGISSRDFSSHAYFFYKI
ncbi:class I SAM-dependent methyltransferase [Bacteroidetes bacterium endosymbiont of Geopemphigus sp.]|uniref:class I SAM-dependent methyltransferase n=1 Tax=Bacteroidetes bacterium endosymbiont of Geopemphigus sp. TaxID=2047937 RepID=UPI000CCFEF03|nr:class I SAM-dependent methyltransferase [Bacteroidetes bacterium endosymbiont of Geopemphigus sp.]